MTVCALVATVACCGLHHTREFTDRVVSHDEWPVLKETMPKGPGAEFPNRPPGNRGLPVLELPDGTLMPESTDIALHIATLVGPPLLPADPAERETAKRLYAASQALPLAWPMVALVRFPAAQAEGIMQGESLGEFMEGPRAYGQLLPTLRCASAWTVSTQRSQAATCLPVHDARVTCILPLPARLTDSG